MAFGNKFTSKKDGMSRAKKTHCCTACLYSQSATYKICPKCGAKGSGVNSMRVYFPSHVEHIRGVKLIMAQSAGQIKELVFHPRYDLVVNNQHLCQYEADAAYTMIETGQRIVEDTKPEGDFIDKLAEFKIALFDILYAPMGLKVKLVR